ncbi:hypothetical protein ONS96_010684 [Cadophora gregata f. sp. sojae]|nr:hypothetical protein ONS96_010684 [Cadophora gregata f. sp. sojae]
MPAADGEKKCRQGGPKTKTGCATCKTRRVKCDEGKPRCQRCEKANWPCKYIPVRKGPLQRTTRTILPSRQICTVRGAGTNHGLQRLLPHLSSFGSQDEYRYFQVFQTNTAPELTGYFDSNIWNRLILQACHHEPYAWHAVVAIGALRKSLKISQLTKPRRRTLARPDDDGSTHHVFALQQYGKSLRLMKEILTQGDESKFHNSLISSLLMICFETYLGNQELALTQIRTGVDILFSWPFKCRLQDDDFSSMKLLAKNYSFVDQDIVSTFLLLDFQAMTSDNRDTRGMLSKKYPDIPPRFETVKEARMVLEVIVRRLRQWRTTVHTQHNPYVATFGVENCADLGCNNQVTSQLEDYFETIKLWYHAFKPVFDVARKKRGCKEYFGANLLMARYIPIRFLFLVADGNETGSDVYLPECTVAVDLLEEVLEQDPNMKPGQATFVFNNHYVLGVFVIALRCRDPTLRRRAIAIMFKYPRREGLWDSVMAAKVASWVMLEEEKGMVDGFVPESARLRIVKNDFSLSERKTVVRCSRLAAEGSKERILLPEATLTW